MALMPRACAAAYGPRREAVPQPFEYREPRSRQGGRAREMVRELGGHVPVRPGRWRGLMPVLAPAVIALTATAAVVSTSAPAFAAGDAGALFRGAAIHASGGGMLQVGSRGPAG